MNKRNLVILFFTMVVMMLGFGIIIPIMPFYIERYGASATDLGALMAVFSVMQFFFAPVWGSLSDRVGRKRILMIGVLGSALSNLIFGFASNLPLMFLSRILGGILSAGTFPSALAFISDNTDERSRGGGMGLIGAAMGVGMILGPGVGGWLGNYSLSAPFFVASGLSFLSMLLILAFLPQSKPQELEPAEAGGRIRLRGPQLKVMWKALFGPLGFLLILAFLVNFSLASFEGIFGLYAMHRYAYGPQQVGSIMTMIGIISSVIQGFLTGMATRRLGEVRVIKLSLAASALGFASMLLAQNYSQVLLTVGFFIFSNAMLRPSISSLISKRSAGGQGMAMGLSTSFESLGRVAGPLWSGTLFDASLNLPYISSAAILFIAFLVSLAFLRVVIPGIRKEAVQESTAN